MFFYLTLGVLMCLDLSLGESNFGLKLPKCSIRDDECLRALYQDMIGQIGNHGIAELGIPSIDPYVVRNVSVSVLNLVNITMVDGIATGATSCVFNKFQIDIENSIGSQEVTCDHVTVKGQYSLSSNVPILKTVLGSGGIHGDGLGKVKIDKTFITWKFRFFPIKGSDGEIYIKCLYKEIEYNYDVKGKAAFAADSIYIGKQNISKFVINYMNENWKFVMQTFGQSAIDRAMEVYFGIAQKFFEGVPTRQYIVEDLSPYLKN